MSEFYNNTPHSSLHKQADNSYLTSDAILNDKYLQQLYAERVKIYSFSIPVVILNKNGKVETIWLDETNHPTLPIINKMIADRIECIKQSI